MIESFIQAFIMLFIIFDPIGLTPMFQAFTAEMKDSERIRVAYQSILTATMILFFFAFSGKFILNLMNVSLRDFEIAAGIVLFILSVELVMGSLEPGLRKIEADTVAVVPLATPLLAGPGSISTVIYLMHPPFGPPQTITAITLNAIIAYVILRNSEKIFSFLGRNGTKALTRIMGLLTASIAISLIRRGIQAYLSTY